MLPEIEDVVDLRGDGHTLQLLLADGTEVPVAG